MSGRYLMFFLDSKLKEQVPPPRPDLEKKKERKDAQESGSAS